MITSPMALRAYIPALRRALWNIWEQSDRLNIALISAGVGFFALLSVFPALAVLVMTWSLLSDPSQISGLIDLTNGIMPDQVHDIFAAQITSLIKTGSETGIGWVTILTFGIALWSARAGVAALIRGLNAVYGIDHRAGFFRREASAFGLTLALCGLAIVAVGVVIVVPVVLTLVPLGALASAVAELVRLAIGFGVVLAALGLIYRYGPNRRGHRGGWITPGAFSAALLWSAISVAFSSYLANFATYNEVYGTLGAAVGLLMWFYLSAYTVLLGAALNAELERHVAA